MKSRTLVFREEHLPLSNIDIRKAIKGKEINFDPGIDLAGQIQPASVDLRLGAKVFKT